jgi:hypothetical protein
MTTEIRIVEDQFAQEAFAARSRARLAQLDALAKGSGKWLSVLCQLLKDTRERGEDREVMLYRLTLQAESDLAVLERGDASLETLTEMFLRQQRSLDWFLANCCSKDERERYRQQAENEDVTRLREMVESAIARHPDRANGRQQ